MLIEKVTEENQVMIITGLARVIWNEHFTPIIGKAQVDYMLDKFQSKKAITEQIENGFMYFLIKENGDDIGYIGVFTEMDRLFLSKLYIVSTERGRGSGSKAVAFLEKLAVELGAKKISLTVNRYNLATIEVYKRLGFNITESMVQDIGDGFVMDDYRMEKLVGITR